MGVLDIDSDQLSDFSEEVDRPALERIALLLAPLSPRRSSEVHFIPHTLLPRSSSPPTPSLDTTAL